MRNLFLAIFVFLFAQTSVSQAQQPVRPQNYYFYYQNPTYYWFYYQRPVYYQPPVYRLPNYRLPVYPSIQPIYRPNLYQPQLNYFWFSY